MAFVKQHDIEKGDIVTIQARGITATGEVLSANHWGDTDGWYIELNDHVYGYRYWKQGEDGGDVVSVTKGA